MIFLGLRHSDDYDLIMCELCRDRELPVRPSACRLVCVLVS